LPGTMVSAAERTAGTASRPVFLTSLRRRYLRSEAVRGYLLLSPTLLVMLSMMIVPLVWLVLLSFATQNYFEIDYSFTLNNYATFFDFVDSPIYIVLLMRSIRMSLTATIAVVLLAYPMAYFLAFRVTRHKLVWLILITVPFWTSYLLRVFA